MKNLLFIFLILGCEKHDSKPSQVPMLDQLMKKYENYLVWSKEVQDKDGWILSEECDALLHTSLYAYSGADSDIYLAQDKDGRFWRRPSRDCLALGKSKSTISRDMILGAMLKIHQDKNLDSISRLIDYVEKTGYMGESNGSVDGNNRITATPQFKATMYTLRDGLGGPYSSHQEIPQTYFPVDGFEAHLQALTILLWGKMDRGLSKVQLNTISAQAEDDPNNALYHAIEHKFRDGVQDKAVAILLREDLFPSDHLPTTEDRCHPYVFMHGEKDKDWLPCQEGDFKVHPGHDFLFTAALIIDESFGLRLRLAD